MNTLLKLILVYSCSLSVHAGGYTFFSGVAKQVGYPEHVLTFVFVSSLILLMGLVYRSKTASASAAIIPDEGTSYRNILESLGEFLYNLAKSIMGEKEASRYFVVIATVFILILSNNLIGLVPGFLPPTSNINTTLALGVFVFIYYNFQGVKEQGLWGHIKHFMGPVWYLAFLILPIELISHAVRPLSLALRLRGNMEGDHLVLAIFSDLVPFLVPVVFYIIGLFVCFVQAFVFTLLTMVYIGLATEHHDHDAEGAH